MATGEVGVKPTPAGKHLFSSGINQNRSYAIWSLKFETQNEMTHEITPEMHQPLCFSPLIRFGYMNMDIYWWQSWYWCHSSLFLNGSMITVVVVLVSRATEAAVNNIALLIKRTKSIQNCIRFQCILKAVHLNWRLYRPNIWKGIGKQVSVLIFWKTWTN